MNTLENQTLLYDKDCPLCNIYTNAFIKAKLLDENGRTAYSAESLNVLPFVDQVKAANEIALIDTKNKTVIYGIDSLLKVIGHSMPWIERIGNFKLVKFLLKNSMLLFLTTEKLSFRVKLTQSQNYNVFLISTTVIGIAILYLHI